MEPVIVRSTIPALFLSIARLVLNCPRLSQKASVNEITAPCRFSRQERKIGGEKVGRNFIDPCWLVQQVNEISSMAGARFMVQPPSPSAQGGNGVVIRIKTLLAFNLAHRPHEVDGVGTNPKLRFLHENHEQGRAEL